MNNENPIMVSLNMAFDEKEKELKAKSPVEKDTIQTEVPNPNLEVVMEVKDSRIEPITLSENTLNQIRANRSRRMTRLAVDRKRQQGQRNQEAQNR